MTARAAPTLQRHPDATPAERHHILGATIGVALERRLCAPKPLPLQRPSGRTRIRHLGSLFGNQILLEQPGVDGRYGARYPAPRAPAWVCRPGATQLLKMGQGPRAAGLDRAA